ncbi:MAG: DUF4143 domain-containing protein [Spirochaetes bacterium]|nr:DUF4143 domain-containing protein [Spirochaetota bacterium]
MSVRFSMWEACATSNASSDSWPSGRLGGSPLRGAVWETFALAEIRKRNAASSDQGRLWFFRDSGGREVDLLLERGGSLDLGEVKRTETPAPTASASSRRSSRASCSGAEMPGHPTPVFRAGG